MGGGGGGEHKGGGGTENGVTNGSAGQGARFSGAFCVYMSQSRPPEGQGSGNQLAVRHRTQDMPPRWARSATEDRPPNPTTPRTWLGSLAVAALGAVVLVGLPGRDVARHGLGEVAMGCHLAHKSGGDQREHERGGLHGVDREKDLGCLCALRTNANSLSKRSASSYRTSRRSLCCSLCEGGACVVWRAAF